MSNGNTNQDLVFGSYNRKDSKVVKAIQSRLETLGINLWLDIQELRPGMEWMQELEATILRARAAVVFKGPVGFGNFQREEISVLFRLYADRKLVVIPALLPGASGRDAGLFLGNIQHIDFRLSIPDPWRELTSALSQNKPYQVPVEPSTLEPKFAHPLVRWIVNEMDNLNAIERYGRKYIAARRWHEALYIYHRLANLAIRRSNRIYADSYLQIGRVYLLAGQPEKADHKWEISMRIYQDYFPSELSRLIKQINALRADSAAYSPVG